MAPRRFSSLGRPEPCHTYNGLASGKPATRVDRLVMAGVWSNEPYYSEMARAVLARVVPALMGRGRIATLEDLRTALGSGDAYELVSQWVGMIRSRRQFSYAAI